MPVKHMLLSIGLATAMILSAPAYAQFDQLNKALGELGKQMEKGKKKQETAPSSTDAASKETASPAAETAVTKDSDSPKASASEKYCFNRKACFSGEKTTYQGQFDIRGLRLGKVDFAALKKLAEEDNCSAEGENVPPDVWRKYATQAGFVYDEKAEYMEFDWTMTCAARSVKHRTPTYIVGFVGDTNFPEHLALHTIIIRVPWDEHAESAELGKAPIIEALIKKFGAPTAVDPTKARWDGEKGEQIHAYRKKRDRQYGDHINVVIMNEPYEALMYRDAYNRKREADKRNRPVAPPPKL